MSKRLLIAIFVLVASPTAWGQPVNKRVIHDAKYYVLEAPSGKKWAAEDKGLDARLAELRKKHGRPPNIVYILWDDMTFGAVGFPALQKNFGFTTPNLNRMATDGINFTRMYSEPSCYPLATRGPGVQTPRPTRHGRSRYAA